MNVDPYKIPLPWARLPCDIHLGGSTAQFLTYGKRQLTQNQFIDSIKKALIYKAKTKPFVLSRRLGCLIGLIYNQLDGDDYMLDCVITAFYQLEQGNYP